MYNEKEYQESLQNSNIDTLLCGIDNYFNKPGEITLSETQIRDIKLHIKIAKEKLREISYSLYDEKIF